MIDRFGYLGVVWNPTSMANHDKRIAKTKHLYTSTDARSTDTDKQRRQHTLRNLESIIVCQIRVEGSEEMQALAARYVCPGLHGVIG